MKPCSLKTPPRIRPGIFIALLPALLLAFAFAFLLHPDQAFAKDSEEVVPVYRLYNKSSQEHLYTTSYTEYRNCVNAGWFDEGIGWYAPKKSNWPVRRLYHQPTGYHLYSQNPVEMNMLVSAGWKLEGVAFYSSERKEVEIRRQFHPVTHLHNYSYNKTEIEFLGQNGWKLEGTAWFARKTPDGALIGKNGTLSPEDLTRPKIITNPESPETAPAESETPESTPYFDPTGPKIIVNP